MTNEQKQNLLAFLGYYTIRVDGIWGTGSEEATRNFQRDYDLSVDGIFGRNTEKRIREVIGNDEKPKEITWDEIKHFKRHEFACKCGKCGGFPVEPDMRVVKLMDIIRDHYGKPIIVGSGIRCKDHNAAVGGASRSQHLYGKAVDFHVDGVTPEELYKYCETLIPNSGGLGIYTWGVHIDVRDNKSRWDYR